MANDERADRITVLGKVQLALRSLPENDRAIVIGCLIQSMPESDRLIVMKVAVDMMAEQHAGRK